MDHYSEKEIYETINSINKAWTTGQPDELKKYFHEQMIIVTPNSKHQIKGRNACINSYIEFCEKANIQEFNVSDTNIKIFKNIVTVSYQWNIVYTTSEEVKKESGDEYFILINAENRWQVIWRKRNVDSV